MTVLSSKVTRLFDGSRDVRLRNILDGAETPSGGPAQEQAIALPWLAGLVPGQSAGVPGSFLEVVVHVGEANVTGTLEYYLQLVTSVGEDSGGAEEVLTVKLAPRSEIITGIDVSKIPPTHRYLACRLLSIGEGDPDEPSIIYGAFMSRNFA